MISENLQKPNFIYEAFNFENLHALSEIFQKCFGQEPGSDYFKWKYIDNPAGKAIAFVALHHNKIAGFYGVIPEFYLVNGKKELIYQSMDTMTHPDYRRMGLFNKLATLTYDHIRQKDGKINLIGFPGQTSYPGFVDKLGWSSLFELKYLFLFRKFFFLRNIFARSSGAQIEEFAEFGREFENYFAQKEKGEKPIVKFMNCAIANWRMANYPGIKHRFVKILKDKEVMGFIVYRLDEKKRVFILHTDFAQQKLARSYIKDIIKYIFVKENAGSIYSFHTPGGYFHAVYQQEGFITNPFRKGPFSYRIPFIVYGDKELNSVDWFDPSNYEIQPSMRDY